MLGRVVNKWIEEKIKVKRMWVTDTELREYDLSSVIIGTEKYKDRLREEDSAEN